jgi:hypothetical protein
MGKKLYRHCILSNSINKVLFRVDTYHNIHKTQALQSFSNRTLNKTLFIELDKMQCLYNFFPIQDGYNYNYNKSIHIYIRHNVISQGKQFPVKIKSVQLDFY